MTSRPLPEGFNWVTARSRCSTAKVFRQLQDEVRADVETAKKEVGEKREIEFDFSASVEGFIVTRVDKVQNKQHVTRVYFELAKEEILVLDDARNVVIKAELTLNNDGECKLKLKNSEELDSWQFRRMALQQLFFGTAFGM